jgi:hypothetical protein
MLLYNSTIDLTTKCLLDDKANSITLRSDIHRIFETGGFTIVRKNGAWVIHFLKLTNDFGPMYHNRQVALDPSVSPHFILARFAWAIFPFTAGFIATNKERLVRLKSPDENGRIAEREFELLGLSVMERAGKKNTRTKRKNDNQEDPETPTTLPEAFSETALAFKQDNNRQLPEPPTCLDPFNRTGDHDMSVPISSAKFDNG